MSLAGHAGCVSIATDEWPSRCEGEEELAARKRDADFAEPARRWDGAWCSRTGPRGSGQARLGTAVSPGLRTRQFHVVRRQCRQSRRRAARVQPVQPRRLTVPPLRGGDQPQHCTRKGQVLNILMASSFRIVAQRIVEVWKAPDDIDAFIRFWCDD